MSGGTIDYGSKVPPYQQLAAFIRASIESGAIPPGRRVPSFTEARGEWGIADKTYRKAIAVLRDAGLVETVPGMGSYVTELSESRLGALVRAPVRLPPPASTPPRMRQGERP